MKSGAQNARLRPFFPLKGYDLTGLHVFAQIDPFQVTDGILVDGDERNRRDDDDAKNPRRPGEPSGPRCFAGFAHFAKDETGNDEDDEKYNLGHEFSPGLSLFAPPILRREIPF